jgi:hypothetical protein
VVFRFASRQLFILDSTSVSLLIGCRTRRKRLQRGRPLRGRRPRQEGRQGCPCPRHFLVLAAVLVTNPGRTSGKTTMPEPTIHARLNIPRRAHVPIVGNLVGISPTMWSSTGRPLPPVAVLRTGRDPPAATPLSLIDATSTTPFSLIACLLIGTYGAKILGYGGKIGRGRRRYCGIVWGGGCRSGPEVCTCPVMED